MCVGLPAHAPAPLTPEASFSSSFISTEPPNECPITTGWVAPNLAWIRSRTSSAYVVILIVFCSSKHRAQQEERYHSQ